MASSIEKLILKFCPLSHFKTILEQNFVYFWTWLCVDRKEIFVSLFKGDFVKKFKVAQTFNNDIAYSPK